LNAQQFGAYFTPMTIETLCIISAIMDNPIPNHMNINMIASGLRAKYESIVMVSL
jgi:hypothetical protein